MALENKIIHQTNNHTTPNNKLDGRTIFWGEVTELLDNQNIKVRIPNIDNSVLNENLPECYTLNPKFFHIYPKIGEVVRIFIEDTNNPQRSRYWTGPIISDLRNINYCNRFDAFSTTNLKSSSPRKDLDTLPDAKGVFPDKGDIGIIGRNNTDIILRDNQIEIRTGKHELNDVTKLNKKNPAIFKQSFSNVDSNNKPISESLIISDKIAILSHSGNPKFKSHNFSNNDLNRIFNNAHPMTRGDVLVKFLEKIRESIILHIHGYNGLPADKDKIITELQNIDFNKILNRNLVIN